MTIFDNLLSRWGYVRKAPAPVGPLLQAVGAANEWNIPDSGLAEAQEELYQRLSWVNSAVSMVAQTAATTALLVKARQGEGAKDVVNHPFEVLLQRPNPKDSRYELLFATFAYHALTGNAYWWLNRESPTEPPAEVWVLPSHQVKPLPDGKMFLRGYEYEPGGTERPITLPTWQVVHFKRFHPRHWFVGLSPIETIATVAKGDVAMQQWNTNLFGKDNAKIPGALAFADPINNTDWERLRKEVREQWGGVQRSGPMMMRGVGKGGIEWVQMAMSQRDMEFLAGRQFTKEEIYSVYAPGLASILAVNATEANAKAGKATFMEMSVWPALVGVAEKITNDVLPSYGTNLVAEFEDVRVSDRAMELEERAAYGQVHTVDEIREHYDADAPIGDGRGELLPSEVGKTLLGGKEPEPVPAALQQAQGGAGQQEAEPEQEEPQEPEEDQATEAAKAAMLEDLRRWRRKALKRGGACEFDSERIPASVARAVEAAMQTSGLDAWRALKAAPDARGEVEINLGEIIARILAEQGAEANRTIRGGSEPDPTRLGDALQAGIEPELTDVANEVMLREAMNIGVEFDTAEVNIAAAEWAKSYTYDLVRGLSATTQKVVANAIEKFLATPGMTEGELEKLLEPAYGAARAEMIAITEVTRAYSAATNQYLEMLRVAGVKMRRVWRTSHDERVCPVCGPLNGEDEGAWRRDFPDGPPAHVRCRCWTVLELNR